MGQHFRGAVTENVFQLRHGEPPVDGQGDGSDLAAGKLQFHELRGVERQDRNPVAFDNTLLLQPVRKSGGPLIQCSVAEFPSCMQIDNCNFIRLRIGVMCSPVIVFHRHDKPPTVIRT